MRAALSLLGLVIVAAIVLSLVKKRAEPLVQRAPPGASAPAATGAALPRPDAVGEQVQRGLDAAAQRAASAAAD